MRPSRAIEFDDLEPGDREVLALGVILNGQCAVRRHEGTLQVFIRGTPPPDATRGSTLDPRYVETVRQKYALP